MARQHLDAAKGALALAVADSPSLDVTRAACRAIEEVEAAWGAVSSGMALNNALAERSQGLPPKATP